MNHIAEKDMDHASVYDALAGGEDDNWAFGTDFEDPLAGVDTTIPTGVSAADLAVYCLMLGDDALVYANRLSEWASNAPDLEEDIALANTALDLLGQARLLLARAALADPTVVPALPASSPVPGEDALAFFRDDAQFRNVRFVEPENGDFAVTVVRLFLFSCYRLALLDRLRTSVDPVLAAIAAKGVKEVTYHRDYAGRWVLTLAQGTPESRRRVEAALRIVLPYWEELFVDHAVESSLAAQGAAVSPSTLRDDVEAVVAQVFSAASLDRPSVPAVGPVNGGMGRDGRHTETLSRMLAEMQSVARAHPEGQW